MKSIVEALKENIAKVSAEEDEHRFIEGSKSASALALLENALKDMGYDPKSVVATKERVIIGKKETTVRISLRPCGFVVAKSALREYPKVKPTVLVHMKIDGINFINPPSLTKALNILINPTHWRPEPKGRHAE